MRTKEETNMVEQLGAWKPMHKIVNELTEILCPDTHECRMYLIGTDERLHDIVKVYACPHCGFHVNQEMKEDKESRWIC